jgi:hypothetical protein
MTTTDTFAAVAIVVSLLSLILSAYHMWLDRSVVSAESHAYKNELTDEYSSVCIRAVNKGRRAVILRYLLGTYSDGSIGREQLEEFGIRLGESEFYEKTFGKFDGIMINDHDNGNSIPDLVDVAFEDTEGRTYKVKNSARDIALIHASKHQFGIRTNE